MKFKFREGQCIYRGGAPGDGYRVAYVDRAKGTYVLEGPDESCVVKPRAEVDERFALDHRGSMFKLTCARVEREQESRDPDFDSEGFPNLRPEHI